MTDESYSRSARMGDHEQVTEMVIAAAISALGAALDLVEVDLPLEGSSGGWTEAVVAMQAIIDDHRRQVISANEAFLQIADILRKQQAG